MSGGAGQQAAAALQRAEQNAHRLGFSPVLERKFRQQRAQQLADGCWHIILPACALAICFVALDVLSLEQDVARFSIIVRLGVEIPLLVCCGLLLRSSRFSEQVAPVAVATALVLGGGVVLVDLIALGSAQPSSGHVALGLVTLATYLLFGLRLSAAVMTASGLLLLWLLTGLAGARSPATFAEGGLILFAAHLLGFLACRQLDLAQRLAFLRAELQAFAGEHDRLTGLYTRAAGTDRVEALLRLGRREQRPAGVALIDVDALPELTERCGEDVADESLVAVAGQVEMLARRPLDFAACLDSGRFLLVLADLGCDEFERIVEQLRQNVAGLGLDHPGSPVARYVTVTCAGLWLGQDWPESSRPLFDGLEAELKEARRFGRNRSEVKAWRLAEMRTKAPVLDLFSLRRRTDSV